MIASILADTLKTLLQPSRGVLVLKSVAIPEISGTSPASARQKTAAEILLRTPKLAQFTSGVSLPYEIFADAGFPLVELCSTAKILPGIDFSAVLARSAPPISRIADENNLLVKLKAARAAGVSFASGCAASGKSESAEPLARFARECQEVGLLPILEVTRRELPSLAQQEADRTNLFKFAGERPV